MPEKLANAPGIERQWFAVYTASRHEKRVAWHLGLRKIEHFLPIYRTQHRWKDGTCVMLDLPLLPGYVLVRIRGNDRLAVLEVPGVVSIVGNGRQPAPLPEFEVQTLREGLNPMRVEPHPLLIVGQRVRIKTGTLAGIEGIVLRTKSGGYRVVLTLELLMQSIAIEVDGEDVEFVDTPVPPTLKKIKQEIEQSARTPLYQFNCLDSYPKKARVTSSVAFPH